LRKCAFNGLKINSRHLDKKLPRHVLNPHPMSIVRETMDDKHRLPGGAEVRARDGQLVGRRQHLLVGDVRRLPDAAVDIETWTVTTLRFSRYDPVFTACHFANRNNSAIAVLSELIFILKMLGLYLFTLIMGHKSCNTLSILNKLIL